MINNGCIPRSISTLTSDSLGRWHTRRVPCAEDAEGGRLKEPDLGHPSHATRPYPITKMSSRAPILEKHLPSFVAHRDLEMEVLPS